jgi:hypothetical protein
MGFEVQTAVSIKITTLLAWTLCSLIDRCQYFAGEPTSPHLHSCYTSSCLSFSYSQRFPLLQLDTQGSFDC